MEAKVNNMKIVSFYRFIGLKNTKAIKEKIENNLIKKNLKGTILIATEGINGSVAGKEDDIEILLKFIKLTLKIRKLELKINEVDMFPFNKMRVRLKKEIVSLGIKNINVKHKSLKFIHPSKWNKIINNKDINIIDVRNPYEIKIGKFKNAINPQTKNFRDFPKKFEKLNINKNDIIAMYCTGGIRCEKASTFLSKKGYKNIIQLKGGILNYLSYFQKNYRESMWNGECFVFDNRVTVKKNLAKGNFEQCYGCRSPITKKDRISKFYKKGVSCPHCYFIRTDEQKKRSFTRQKQKDEGKIML